MCTPQPTHTSGLVVLLHVDFVFCDQSVEASFLHIDALVSLGRRFHGVKQGGLTGSGFHLVAVRRYFHLVAVGQSS